MDVKSKRAALAIRLSHLTDATSSPERQLEVGQDWARRNGAELALVLDDLDISASRVKPEDRPKLGPFLTDPPRDITHLIFWRVDRIARNVIDFSRLLEWGKARGVALIDVSQGIDFSSPVNQALGVILSLFAQMEAQAIRDRILGTRDYMRRVARWGAGRVPYGYRTCPHPTIDSALALCPDIDEHGKGPGAEVRRWVDLVLDGAWSRGAIVADLIARDVPTSDEATWGTQTVTKILRNRSMTGAVQTSDVLMDAGGQPLQDSKGRQLRGPKRDVRGEDGEVLRYAADPLITEERYALLQQALDKTASGAGVRRTTRSSQLYGVVTCAVCGRFMHQTGGTGKQRSYSCPTLSQRDVPNCPTGSILASEAETFALRRFTVASFDTPVMRKVVDPGDDVSGLIAAVEGEIERVADELARCDADDETLQTLWRNRLTKKSADLKTLKARHRVGGERFEDTGVTVGQAWESWTADQRREYMTQTGFRVGVWPGVKGGHVWETDQHGERRWVKLKRLKAGFVRAGKLTTNPTYSPWEIVETIHESL